MIRDSGRTQGNRLEVTLAKRVQQARQHIENYRRSTGTSSCVPVMKKQDITALESVGQSAVYPVRIAIHGIETASSPTCQSQVQTAQHGIEKRIAKTGGRAEELRRRAGYGNDAILCSGNLGTHGGGPQQ